MKIAVFYEDRFTLEVPDGATEEEQERLAFEEAGRRLKSPDRAIHFWEE